MRSTPRAIVLTMSRATHARGWDVPPDRRDAWETKLAEEGDPGQIPANNGAVDLQRSRGLLYAGSSRSRGTEGLSASLGPGEDEGRSLWLGHPRLLPGRRLAAGPGGSRCDLAGGIPCGWARWPTSAGSGCIRSRVAPHCLRRGATLSWMRAMLQRAGAGGILHDPPVPDRDVVRSGPEHLVRLARAESSKTGNAAHGGRVCNCCRLSERHPTPESRPPAVVRDTRVPARGREARPCSCAHGADLSAGRNMC